MNLRSKETFNPYSGKQKSTIFFIFTICLLAFSLVFSLSGYASIINFNEWLCFLIVVILIATQSIIPIIKSKFLKDCYVLFVTLLLLLILLNYNYRATQIINLVSCFGFVPITQMFSKIKWEKQNLLNLGMAICMLEIILLNCFLPGRIFSGWNPNSISVSIPILLLGLSCIWCSKNKLSLAFTIVFLILALVPTSSLENRSSLLTILLFAILMTTGLFTYKRKRFRCLYIGLILINVLIPYINSGISNTDIFHDLLGVTSEMTATGKNASGFNGREILWSWSINEINGNPFLGSYGVRLIYPHNFSMDLLLQFGWIGWFMFIGLLVSVFEYAFREGSTYNIFLIGFASLLFLNTFENVLTCCNIMQFFPYVLLAIAIRINRNIVYEH